MCYTVGGKTYEAPIKCTMSEAPPEAQNNQLKNDLKLTPFNDESMFVGIGAPDGCPLIGGANRKIRLWQPEWYINFDYNPFGFIRFSAKTPEFGYFRDTGQPDAKRWGFHPKSSPLEQFNKHIAKMNDQRAKSAAAQAKDGRIKQIGLSQTLSFTGQFELMGAATWNFKEKESRGRAQLSFKAGANYSLMETFWAGPIPVVIQFSVGLNLTIAGEAGYVSPSVWSFDQYRWDWGSTGLELQIRFPPALSVGVGIAGVFSFSIKGALIITFYSHAGPLPEGYKDLPNPHLRLMGVIRISFEVEILFFTDTYVIWENPKQNWYDNWEGKLAQDLQGSASPLQGAQLGSALDNASIITDDSLAAVAEFETAGFKNMNPPGTVLTHYVLNRIEDGKETLFADMLLSESKAREFGAEQGVLLVSQADDAGNGLHAMVSGKGDGDDDLVAGSSSALTAQDDSQVEFVLRPAFGLLSGNGGSDDADDYQVMRWETELPAATPVGDHSYQVIPSVTPGVLGLGKEQGVLTGTDMRVAENILSASRLKLFSADSGDYILRIGVVMVGGNARTRIIAESVDGRERRVLDFMTNRERDGCFDYDFDISKTHVNGEEVINMVVVSDPRPQGDGTSLTGAAGQTFISMLTCKDWSGVGTFTGWTFPASFFDTIGDDGRTYPCRHYSCPQIRQIVGTRDGVQYGHAVVTFLVRASKSEDELMGDDPDLTRTGVGLLFFDDHDQSVSVSGMSIIRAILASDDIADPTLIEAKLSEQAGGLQVITLKGTEKTYESESAGDSTSAASTKASPSRSGGLPSTGDALSLAALAVAGAAGLAAHRVLRSRGESDEAEQSDGAADDAPSNQE